MGVGDILLTGKAEALDRMALLLKALAEPLALSGFTRAVETLDNNQGSASGLRHSERSDANSLTIYRILKMHRWCVEL